jgi:Sporulation delaying protein SdpA
MTGPDGSAPGAPAVRDGAERGQDRAATARGLAFTGCLLLTLFLVSCTQFVSAAGGSPALSSTAASIAPIWPQGWAFFAAEPSGNVAVAFPAGPGGLRSPLNQREMSAAADWGLNRSAMAQDAEIFSLVALIPPGDRLTCGALTPAACAAAALRRPTAEIANRARPATVCGHLLLATVSPERWTGDTRLWMSEWKIETVSNAVVVCGG